MLSDCDRLECGSSAECEWREYYLREVWLECLSEKVRVSNVKVRVSNVKSINEIFEGGCEWLEH